MMPTDAQEMLNEIYDSKIADRETVAERWLKRAARHVTAGHADRLLDAGYKVGDIEFALWCDSSGGWYLSRGGIDQDLSSFTEAEIQRIADVVEEKRRPQR